MILTNVTALLLRVEQTKVLDNFSVANRRLSSGVRMIGSPYYAVGLSQANCMQSKKVTNQLYPLNLQGAQFYSLTQLDGLQKVLKIYERIVTVSLLAMDRTVSGTDHTSFNIEISALGEQLEKMMSFTYQGRRFYNATLLCDDVKNIAFGELDLEADNTPEVTHAVRAETINVHASSGTISPRLNSVCASDIYLGWVREKFLLNVSKPNREPVHTQNYDDPDFSFASWVWVTSSSAIASDDDIFEVSFGSGKSITYKIYTKGSSSRTDGTIFKSQNANNIKDGGDFHKGVWKDSPTWSFYTGTPSHDSDEDGIIDNPSLQITDNQKNALSGVSGWITTAKLNNTDRSDYQNWTNSGDGTEFPGHLNKNYRDHDFGYYSKIPNVIFTEDLPRDFQNTVISIQIKTETVGIIYAEDKSGHDGDSDGTETLGIYFFPEHPDFAIPMNQQGNEISIVAKSFGALYSESPVYGEFYSPETVGMALDTLNHLRGNGDNYGKVRSVIDDCLSAVTKEINCINQEIEKLEQRLLQSEATIAKLADANIAVEATALAKSKIRSDLAISCISKSSRINDALIPLTTNQFEAAILKHE